MIIQDRCLKTDDIDGAHSKKKIICSNKEPYIYSPKKQRCEDFLENNQHFQSLIRNLNTQNQNKLFIQANDYLFDKKVIHQNNNPILQQQQQYQKTQFNTPNSLQIITLSNSSNSHSQQRSNYQKANGIELQDYYFGKRKSINQQQIQELNGLKQKVKEMECKLLNKKPKYLLVLPQYQQNTHIKLKYTPNDLSFLSQNQRLIQKQSKFTQKNLNTQSVRSLNEKISPSSDILTQKTENKLYFQNKQRNLFKKDIKGQQIKKFGMGLRNLQFIQ